MKKALLLLFSLIFLAGSVFAYQTVIIHFPKNNPWKVVYNRTVGTETIVQYVPSYQSYKNWVRTIIVHAYKAPGVHNAATFMDKEIARMLRLNPTKKYSYKKYNVYDSMAVRCTKEYKDLPEQCEILKVMMSNDGIYTIHYIDKNIAYFEKNYEMWYDIIKNTTIYYSYYRDERVMNKRESIEY